MIKCEECGREISSKVNRCPYCGCPIETMPSKKIRVIPKKKTNEVKEEIHCLKHDKACNDNYKAYQSKEQHNENFCDKRNEINMENTSAKTVMGFREAIKSFYVKYFDFKGKATRSEYWWLVFYETIISAGIYILSLLIPPAYFLSYVFSVTHIIPGWALMARRLHDVGKPTIYLLFLFLPIAGPFVIIFYMLQKSVE